VAPNPFAFLNPKEVRMNRWPELSKGAFISVVVCAIVVVVLCLVFGPKPESVPSPAKIDWKPR
jgi:hypothetical protein